MDVSDEVRAAAKRIARWEACCKTGDIYEHEYFDEPDRQWNDESPVIDWAVARIEADDAEQAERARPIDEEWLRSLGFIPEHDLAWHFGRVSVRQYAQCVGDDVESTILLDDNEILWRATRGQLIDLLAALQGGAK